MSGYVSGLVWKTDLPRNEKYVMLSLADHAQDDGTDVYPSVRLTALKVGLSDRMVQKYIQSFVSRGLLEVMQDAGYHRPTRYRIRMDRFTFIPELAPKIRPKKVPQKGEMEFTQMGEMGDTQKGEVEFTQMGEMGDGVRVKSSASTYKVLETSVRETSIKSLSLTQSEREETLKELKRLCPTINSLPDRVPIERAYLFVHRIKQCEIRRENLYSPIAYLTKMHDEDISGLLQNERARKAKAQVGSKP